MENCSAVQQAARQNWVTSPSNWTENFAHVGVAAALKPIRRAVRCSATQRNGWNRLPAGTASVLAGHSSSHRYLLSLKLRPG